MRCVGRSTGLTVGIDYRTARSFASHNLANPLGFGKHRLMHRRPGCRLVPDWRLGVAPRQIVRILASPSAGLDVSSMWN
jgi:hypothetical protein